MRRYRPALILLALLALALPTDSDALRRKKGIPSTTVLSMPLTSSGARFSDDAGTKSHVVFDGAGLTDLYGNSWSMVGTVPQVDSTAMPTTQDTGAAGPYSASNYYTLGTGSDVLDTDQQVHGCIAFYMSSTMTYGVLYDNSLNMTRGRIVRLDLGPVLAFISFDPTNRGVSAAVTEGTAGIPALNVACWWHTASEVGINVNGTESISLGAWTEVPGTSDQARLGIESAGTTYPFVEGGIIEFTESTGVTCPGASCSAWAAGQVLQKFGATGLTTTRATPATYENDSRMWRIPSGVPRITPKGLLTEAVKINRITESEELNLWPSLMTSVTPDQGPSGWADLDRLVHTNSIGNVNFTSGTAGTTSCVSAWVAAVSGTTSVSLLHTIGSGSISSCTCGRSDGVACTPAACTGASGTITFANVTTTPTRLWHCMSHTSAGPVLYIHGGVYTSTYNDILAGRAQIEVGVTRPSSYIPSTAGTPVQRNADAITTPWPAGISSAGPWCISATHTPHDGVSRGGAYSGIWSTDTVSAQYADTAINVAMTRHEFSTDGTGAVVAALRTGVPATGSTSLTGCFDAGAGSQVAYVDRVAGTPASPFSISSTFTQLRIGLERASTYYAEGFISGLRACSTANVARCR